MSRLLLPGGGTPLGVELLSTEGPIPPSRLVKRLKEISDRLEMTWHPVMKNWMVTETWHPNDKRWKLHREGVIGAPMDTVCFLPTDADPETVGDFIIEQVHKCDLSKHVGRRKLINRIREMQEHNRRTSEKNRLAAMEPVVAAFKDAKGYILRHPGRLAKEQNVTVQYRRKR